jgi:16S rRNA A1518/A1519 N6-dimethyltransferase RsmA/KsgA/DIM1 with predicted DNA glycosylase/AP lyase activity
MNTQAYEKRNLQGFEGDEFIARKVKSLIDEFGINWVIETGTYLGGTTKRFAEMCEMVSTTEINDGFYLRAKSYLQDLENVTQFYGDSVAILPAMLKVTLDKNILFFLDAHWTSNLPLLAELEIINEFKAKHGNIVIAIHDFKVPGRADLGFDTYGKVSLEWDYIKESIQKIYGPQGYKIQYNLEAEGAKRGIIYIMPV